MYSPTVNVAKEAVKEVWKLSTKPRYKAPPKTKKYFVVPRKKKS